MVIVNCQLFLSRHGQTIANARQIMQGQTDGDLSPEGVLQAEALRDRFAATPIDAFYASDLIRARRTCEIVAAPHRLPVATTPLLRERDWGGFTGRFIPDLKDAPWPDDIETIDAIKARVSRFLSLLRARHAGQTVFVVAHGITNKALQSVVLGKPMKDIPRMENAEVRTLFV